MYRSGLNKCYIFMAVVAFEYMHEFVVMGGRESGFS